MVDVALVVLDADAVDALVLAGGAEGDDREGLRLTASEQGAAGACAA